MSQRFEREIDEILRKFDGQSTTPRPFRRRTRSQRYQQRFFQGLWSLYNLRWRWGAGELMLAAYGLALVSFVLLPLLPILAAPIGWALVGLFVGGYLLGYRRANPRPPRTWRGRVVGTEPIRWAALWQSLRAYWRRRRP